MTRVRVDGLLTFETGPTRYWLRTVGDERRGEMQARLELGTLLADCEIVGVSRRQIVVVPTTAPQVAIAVMQRDASGMRRVVDARDRRPSDRTLWGGASALERAETAVAWDALAAWQRLVRPDATLPACNVAIAAALSAPVERARHVTHAMMYRSPAAPHVLLQVEELHAGAVRKVVAVIGEPPVTEGAAATQAHAETATDIVWVVSEHAADRWVERFEPEAREDPRDRIEALIRTAVHCGHRARCPADLIYRTPRFPAADFIVHVDRDGAHYVATVLDPPHRAAGGSLAHARAIAKGTDGRRVHERIRHGGRGRADA